MQDRPYELLFDGYFPFKLYADSLRGLTADQLAATYGMPSHWIAERIEAARLCLEKQVRITKLESENAA